jgi:hypothetical protein
MRKLAIIMAMALVLGGAFAMSAQATPTTLADYIALGSTGVTIDDKTFYDFAYSGTAGGAATPIQAADIKVFQILTPLNPGLSFQAAWSVAGGDSLDSLITYYVKVNPGGAPIADVSASMTGYTFSGPGVVSVGETVKLASSTIAAIGLHADQTGTVDFVEASFTPTAGPLFVSKDISVNGHTNGQAAVSFVTNQFSEVPVPPTALLLGTGLLGLVGFRVRKNRA